MTDRSPIDLSVSFRDPRVGREPRRPRPDAVDDARVRQSLRAAAEHRGPERLRVSVSRIHGEAGGSELRWPVKALRRIDFVDCDLAGSHIAGGLFSRLPIEDCSFDQVRLDPFHGAKLDVSDSRFDRVDFAGRVRADLRDSTMTRCLFERCDIRYLTFRRCEFKDVVFDRPRASRTSVRGGQLQGVRFRGKQGRWFFHDCRLEQVDFSEAEPADLVFDNADLNAVRFPYRPDCFVVLERAIARVGPDLIPAVSDTGRRDLAIYMRMFESARPEPLLVGRGLLAAFDDPADRRLFAEALFPHAVTEI